MTSAHMTGDPGTDLTESYLDNDLPKLLKMLFWGLILWGIIFAAYFIMTGYDSEKEFEAAQGGAQSRVIEPLEYRVS